jgi:hypothetical protein
MDLAEEREDSSLILVKIESSTKKTSPEDENETPQVKETCPKSNGTNPESLVLQVSSIPMVNCILPSYAIHISI